MTIFVCKDEFDSILCGVYDAWMSGLGHENVRLITRTEQQNQTMQMFVEYREAEEASWKIKKTAEAIRRKISQERGFTERLSAGKRTKRIKFSVFWPGAFSLVPEPSKC